MPSRRFVAAIAVLAAAVVGGVTLAQTNNWYPSRWGAADQRGAANRITAAKVLEAKSLITSGTVYQLGHVYEAAMPLFGTRSFALHTKRTNGPLGANKRYSNEELVVTELGQVGTQLDMFSHQGIDGQSYNCVPIDALGGRTGFQKLGIEKIGTLFARGVLIDVAAFKGLDMLTANFLFRGVLLPAGRSTVEFKYQPQSLRAGAAISLAAFVILAGLVFRERRRAVRTNASVPG